MTLLFCVWPSKAGSSTSTTAPNQTLSSASLATLRSGPLHLTHHALRRHLASTPAMIAPTHPPAAPMLITLSTHTPACRLSIGGWIPVCLCVCLPVCLPVCTPQCMHVMHVCMHIRMYVRTHVRHTRWRRAQRRKARRLRAAGLLAFMAPQTGTGEALIYPPPVHLVCACPSVVAVYTRIPFSHEVVCCLFTRLC